MSIKENLIKYLKNHPLLLVIMGFTDFLCESCSCTNHRKKREVIVRYVKI